MDSVLHRSTRASVERAGILNRLLKALVGLGLAAVPTHDSARPSARR